MKYLLLNVVTTVAIAFLVFGQQTNALAQPQPEPRPSRAVATVSFPLNPPKDPEPGKTYPHTIVYVVNYSDLINQIALQPNSPLDDPRPEDLTSAMKLMIDRTLLRHAAGMFDSEIRSAWPTYSENQRMIAEMASVFPSRIEFENRLTKANLGSSDSPRFRVEVMYRWHMQRYIDRHFRTLVNVTPQDEEKYYDDVFKPDFRLRNPGRLLPTLEENRSHINRILAEKQVKAALENELGRLRQVATIKILKRFTTEDGLIPKP